MKRLTLCLAVIVGIAIPATSLAQEYPAPQPKPPTPPAEQPAPPAEQPAPPAEQPAPPQEQAAEIAPTSEGVQEVIVKNDAMKFEPLEVPGFDPGLSLAVIHGNPNAESGDYTVRLRLPADYRFPPHFHPKAEHVTVLNGTLLLAMGDEVIPDATQEYGPGDFLYLPAEKPHFGGVDGDTVLQLHGEAPFRIILVEAGS